jgi:hypothetical protein
MPVMCRATRLAALLVAVFLTAACSDPPLKVDAIQLGRSLNVDQSIATLTTAFKPNDTIYVSVLTTARGAGTIRVRWYLGTQLLSDREKQASFQGAGATEFHMQSATGFPDGEYSVDVTVDGQPAGRRNFQISK